MHASYSRLENCATRSSAEFRTDGRKLLESEQMDSSWGGMAPMASTAPSATMASMASMAPMAAVDAMASRVAESSLNRWSRAGLFVMVK